MANNQKLQWLFFTFSMLVVCSCESQQKRYNSPPGYDLGNPKRFRMPDQLREISGIAFNNGKPDTLYAEQDEDGKVYHFKLGDTQLNITRFAKKGDFEDITICRSFIIMLRSDGTLFTFPISETNKKETDQVKIFDGLLPHGEYEGLSSENADGKVFVLCKHCSNEKSSKWGGGSILQLDATGNLTPFGNFEINIKEIESITGTRKIDFHPSALSYNTRTEEWFILSSVNHVLVVADKDWKARAVYPLDPALFPQPEGITFDTMQNMYISSERGLTKEASVLVFPFHNK